MTPTSRRAAIVHGYEASPSDHWFPWLSDQLEQNGIQSTVVEMPDSENPDSDAWLSTLRAALPAVDANATIIGHSLGCLTALRYLAALEGPWTLGHLVLVSGFTDKLPTIPALDEFVGSGVAIDAIRANVESITVISSDDDPTVSPAFTADLADCLHAELVVIPGAGHFLEGGGFPRTPRSTHSSRSHA